MEVTPDAVPPRRARTKAKSDAAPRAAKKPRASRKPPVVETTTVNVTALTHERSQEEMGGMIAIAAYFLAEQRDFTPGHELDDWLEAERRIHSSLGADQVR